MKYSYTPWLITALLATGNAFACSPPAALSTRDGPNGSRVPYQDPTYFAFLGKVVGHSVTSNGDPALVVQVLDAWTDRQTAGQFLTIGVAQWQGCGLTTPMGEPFHPENYPVGTRVRIVSRDQTMFTWDTENGILVLGAGT